MLATRQFAARHAEFERRDVLQVHLFHSPAAALAGFAHGPAALPFAVVADPDRVAYRAWGIGRSWLALLSWRALARVREARGAGLAPRFRDGLRAALRDGIGGSPAEFLVGRDGRIAVARYGAHFADAATPAEVLAWIDTAPALE